MATGPVNGIINPVNRKKMTMAQGKAGFLSKRKDDKIMDI